jgi:hypothetical protein
MVGTPITGPTASCFFQIVMFPLAVVTNRLTSVNAAD